MNKFAVTLAAAALLVAGPAIAPALAQDAVLPTGTFIAGQTPDEYLAKDQLIGSKVYDTEGKIIGDVEDLILNDTNQVVGVVMGTGGFLGLAEKKVGVHLTALDFVEKDGKSVVVLPEATTESS